MSIKSKKDAKRIRTGDAVVAITGNERGKAGKVLRRMGKDRVIVQGLNVKRKAVKRSQAAPQGGIIDREMPIHVSNLMVCGEETKGVKLKVATKKDGLRELCYTKEGKKLTYRQVKKAK